MITNEQIIKANKEILAGKKVADVTKEMGISRQFYYQKIKELGLSTKKDFTENKENKEITKIEDMHDLATLLNTDFNTIHEYVNKEKSIISNIKRMSYLKNNSPIKFQEAVIITIINYYKYNAVALGKLLEKDKKDRASLS